MRRAPALAGFLAAIGRGIGDLSRWLVWIFSRSLQVRIVVLTVALTLIAILGVGTYMTQVIARGLFESKLTALSDQTNTYVVQLESAAAEEDLSEALTVHLQSMYSRSPSPLRSISLEPRDANSAVLPITVLDTVQESPRIDQLPEDFRTQVAESVAGQQRYLSISLAEEGDAPGLVITQSLSVPGAGQFDLFVVADLGEEQATLDFVTRAAGVAGVVLVVLVGAVGLLVSRLVVTPVRTGSEVARQIADGDLDRRMPVTGRDEISQLAQSFNDMADSMQDQIMQMERLSVLQRQFVSDVSHELRTPLTTIHIASDMLYETRDDFDESARRSAELLNSQVDRFEQLLGDLLEISRYDAGAAELVTHPHDLREIVTGIVETLAVVAERSGSQVRIHAPQSPVMAELDRVRITRVIRNLAVNAIEHGDGQPIDIHLASNAEAAAVSVRDHGVGMTADNVEHVFDRFWRADPSRKRTLGGSGLGLAIALEDAHLHGGWLQAWGEKGEGSCFRLTIPRRNGQAITTSPLPLPPSDAAPRAALVAGPSSSDGSIRIQTGSIPIVVESAGPVPGSYDVGTAAEVARAAEVAETSSDAETSSGTEASRGAETSHIAESVDGAVEETGRESGHA